MNHDSVERPPYEQCLMSNGRILDDTWTVDVAGLCDGTSIQLMFHDGRVVSKGRPAPVLPPRKRKSSFIVQIKVS